MTYWSEGHVNERIRTVLIDRHEAAKNGWIAVGYQYGICLGHARGRGG